MLIPLLIKYYFYKISIFCFILDESFTRKNHFVCVSSQVTGQDFYAVAVCKQGATANILKK